MLITRCLNRGGDGAVTHSSAALHGDGKTMATAVCDETFVSMAEPSISGSKRREHEHEAK